MCLKEVILDVTFQDRISGSDRVVPNFERSMKLTINSLLFCVLELKLFRLFFLVFLRGSFSLSAGYRLDSFCFQESQDCSRIFALGLSHKLVRVIWTKGALFLDNVSAYCEESPAVSNSRSFSCLF